MGYRDHFESTYATYGYVCVSASPKSTQTVDLLEILLVAGFSYADSLLVQWKYYVYNMDMSFHVEACSSRHLATLQKA
jgi:hypothetical protein